MKNVHDTVERALRLPLPGAELQGDLVLPPGAAGLVIFAHGSGSSRHSVRNRAVASAFQQAALGTLLFDLLTSSEESVDNRTMRLRFDIPLLADRLTGVIDWSVAHAQTGSLPIGLFGASTGAAAALVAASRRPAAVAAVVSRGGRPDLAGAALPDVKAPTLLIVGGSDEEVLALNRQAERQLRCQSRLEIVPGATHLFEEPGALDKVALLARDWFLRNLAPAQGTPGSCDKN
jgi:pimeloyl-ACP methyl ester carboxylesterase